MITCWYSGASYEFVASYFSSVATTSFGSAARSFAV